MEQLTDDDKAILDFERQAWTHAGAKETAIVQTFGVPGSGRQQQDCLVLLDSQHGEVASGRLE